jgi:HSP20 family protein
MKILSSISPDRSWPISSLPRNQMDYIFGDFEKIIEGALRSTYEGKYSLQPRCDIRETKDHYLASFDVPGARKEDIKIEILGNQMVISGERREDLKTSENELSHHQERLYGKFERTFNLPNTVNTERIEAQYENGVLSIAIPKAEMSKGRTIQIQSGQESIFNKLLSSKKESNKDQRDVKVS